MSDTTAEKISDAAAPTGEMGQVHLASGERVAMRLWRDEPPGEAKPATRRDYETVGYVIAGRAELAVGGQVLRLGPGDHYGEIGVLTDKPSTATIIALTPVTLYELAKVELGRIVEARPEVAHELAGAIARRQAAGLTVGPAEVDVGVPPHRLANWFTTRLQRLYGTSKAA